MKHTLFFVCKRGRLRDIPLLRDGAIDAGYRFMVTLIPFAYPLLLLLGISRIFGAKFSIIFSDKFWGDTVFAKFLGDSCVRMLWNYADEFPDRLSFKPNKRVCFFKDDEYPAVERFVFAPQPKKDVQVKFAPRKIGFIGDVSLTSDLPNGTNWWITHFDDLIDKFGYQFYLTEEFNTLINANLSSLNEQRQAKVLSKNYLRFKILNLVNDNFSSNLIIIGENWRRFGFNAQASLYSLDSRLEFYKSLAVNLDAGSKSGDSSLYPRSSEIMTYAGSPVQVICEDSISVFGEKISEFVFADEVSLMALIDDRLSEPENVRLNRIRWLNQQLHSQEMTMSCSVRRLFTGRESFY
ncbi:hypothetical protein [Undibacterium crateris]|uniref:hypothetical protein n=1 Tax=Undibacterium crateris TaxID=2528175 RepID=UPI0013899BD6|nr:hypothetical protein [Undibacterium crateris]NDI84629.1 hypothetical protein [Undibacterium crateris]